MCFTFSFLREKKKLTKRKERELQKSCANFLLRSLKQQCSFGAKAVS